MEQTTLTVIAPIKAGETDSLKELLNVIGDDIKDNGYIKFTSLPTTHFARWVIIPEDGKKGYKPYLAFESNFDGRVDDYLDDLADRAGGGLDQIYGKCEGYPVEGTKNRKAFKKYIRDHSLKYAARYIAYRGRSVKDIRNNTMLRDRVEAFLDEGYDSHALDGVSEAELRKKIQAFLREEQGKDPRLATAPVTISYTWRKVALVLAIVAALVVLFPFPVFFLPLPLWARLVLFFTPMALLGLFLFVLRTHEKADDANKDQLKMEFVPVEEAIFRRENHQVQNQLTHIVEIKPGKFRLYTLKTVLWIINLAAKLYWYKGELGSIPTIHFARWVILDNRRLLFFSNFDGSWENYLGDFIDKAAIGLTGVWSNAVEFPKTRFLILDGATDEERFKEWARAKQIPTQVWYTAHANETVKNILNNFEIRNNIENDLNRQQTEQWLQRF